VGELDTYRAKRRFDRTPEPSGETAGGPDGGALPRFVVQEHHARRLHWDVRLERDGVLVSWAVPKGIPPDPRLDHLAVQTEDHPLEYLTFEGDIPEGEYGAGHMTVWDQGVYECEKWEDREVMVVLRGERANGRYVLFRTGGRNWMIHRMDPPEDASRELLPDDLRPLPAVAAAMPDDQAAWAFEPAWRGLTVALVSQGGRLRITDADGREMSDRFPELSPLGRALGALEVAMEGEVVLPDPAALERRLGLHRDAAVRRHADQDPAVFLAADLLWLEGHSTTPLAGRDRRALLDRLALKGPRWDTLPTHPGDGDTLLEAVRAQGLPGVRARALDRPYETPLLIRA
jgi:bifunctional non-homologous end joining protein LigD